MALLRIIKEPAYALTWAGFAFLIFDVCLYLMLTLPGTRDGMCVEGVNFTWDNILFGLFLSLLFGLILTTLLYSVVRHTKLGVDTSILGTIGSVIGFFTLFCGACSATIIASLFASLGLGTVAVFLRSEEVGGVMDFIVAFSPIIKIACLLLMVYTLYLLNKRIEQHWLCALPKKKSSPRS